MKKLLVVEDEKDINEMIVHHICAAGYKVEAAFDGEAAIDLLEANGFDLSQNYPNPFNPSTSIRYEVADRVHVTLSVYNLLGQKVATLVDGIRQAGSYTVTWDASTMASGAYVYRLEAGADDITRKMTLVE